jgi:hypothetical protein
MRICLWSVEMVLPSIYGMVVDEVWYLQTAGVLVFTHK